MVSAIGKFRAESVQPYPPRPNLLLSTVITTAISVILLCSFSYSLISGTTAAPLNVEKDHVDPPPPPLHKSSEAKKQPQQQPWDRKPLPSWSDNPAITHNMAPFRPSAIPIYDFGAMRLDYLINENVSDADTTYYWDSTSKLPINVAVACESDDNDGITSLYRVIGNLSSDALPAQVKIISLKKLVQQGLPRVTATATIVEFVPQEHEPNFERLRVEFYTPRLPHDEQITSWPVTFIDAVLIQGDSSKAPSCTLFVEAAAQNALHINEPASSRVAFDYFPRETPNQKTQRMGKAYQHVLGSSGDHFTPNWGFLHLSVPTAANGSTLVGGTIDDVHDEWLALHNHSQRYNGGNDEVKDCEPPNIDGCTVAWKEAALAAFAKPLPAPYVVTSSGGQASSIAYVMRAILSYDEIYAQYFFGHNIIPRWKCHPKSPASSRYVATTAANVPNLTDGTSAPCAETMEDLLDLATVNADELRGRSVEFDTSFTNQIKKLSLGEQYAPIAHLAYRQTIAANNYGYSPYYNPADTADNSLTSTNYWVFQKEISSDGDINTFDVIFPSSPWYFVFNPSMLREIISPQIIYSTNQTWHPYSNPFCPHHLGVFPLANVTTAGQEVMPLENTGNLFLLLNGMLKFLGVTDDNRATASASAFFYPQAWPVMTTWAENMIETQLPYPPKQIYTDDFSGPSANNTNLAVKAIISLEAFAELCELLTNNPEATPNTVGGAGSGIGGAQPCSYYSEQATNLSNIWRKSIKYDPSTDITHSPFSFSGSVESWSIKYNFLWQRLLGLKGPFSAQDESEIRRNELSLYKLKGNEHRYGFPIDSRFNFTKYDWETWGLCFTDSVEDFKDSFEQYMFPVQNETEARNPMSDMFSTDNGLRHLDFVARPVVGALMMPLLIFGGNNR